MRKEAIYIRTSTKYQTPETQLEDIYKMNPSPDAVIFKEHVSAWRDNILRHEFEKLKREIRKRKIKTLYVWGLDRLFRNRKKLVEFLELCKILETKVLSFNEKWMSNIQLLEPPFNEVTYDFMLEIIGWVAEDESSKKSKRVKSCIKKTSKGTYSRNGKKWGRKGLPKQTINRILEQHKLGKSIRQISLIVKSYDSNNNEKKISSSCVHEIIKRDRNKKIKK